MTYLIWKLSRVVLNIKIGKGVAELLSSSKTVLERFNLLKPKKGGGVESAHRNFEHSPLGLEQS